MFTIARLVATAGSLGTLNCSFSRSYWNAATFKRVRPSLNVLFIPISNASISSDLISSSDAKHVLLIVDSCFSGSLMRGSGDQKSIEKLTSKRIERLQAKKTRIVITSGGTPYFDFAI